MSPTMAISSPALILLVDDDYDIRESLADMLEHEGYGVHAVGTGAEAIQQAHNITYGAVLLDIGLPDLDGHSVLKALSEMDPTLPVIILTGQATEQNTIGPLTKGAFAYTTKPYKPNEIKAVLRRAVNVRALSSKAQTVEYALSASEERFRSVVQSTSDAIILAEDHGRIIFWNHAAQRMFGYTDDEVMGKPLTLIMPARYREAHQRGLERVRSSGAQGMIGKTLELHGLKKDGGEFPIELSLATWETQQGTFYGGIIRDITERKRAEEDLSRSQQELADFFENAPMGLHWVGPDGYIQRANRAELALLGYTPDEYIGHHIAEFHANRDVIEDILQRLRNGETLQNYEASLRRKDGSLTPVLISSNVLWENNRFIHTRCFTRDIGDWKRAEEARQQSEERFRQLAENIKEVFWLKNARQDDMIYISPGYEDLWGRSCESLYAKPQSWFDAIHPDDQPRVAGAMTTQILGTYCEDYRIIRPDGTTRWIRDRAFPIRDESGQIYRIAGIAECITQQKIADQRQAAQYAVTRALAESATLAEATPKILQAICHSLGWDLGAIWCVDERADVLRCLELWHSDRIHAAAFKEFSERNTFRSGAGLPGRVWATGEPTWLSDATKDDNFPRASVASDAGLHSALAFPIKLNAGVMGVFEFFSRDIRQPDEDLLHMLGSIGSQIGQFTERKRAQEALRQAYDKMDAILVSLPCAILIVDEDYRVLYANPPACEQFAPEHATLIGSSLQEVLPVTASHWDRLVADLRSTAQSGTPTREQEFEARKRTHRYRLFPVTLHGDQCQQAGIVIWDITEQKQLQDQLIQAEKLSSLGTLVSGMAHEINNPVQGILGMAEIILQEPNPERVKEYARDIVAYSEHVGEVVRNFACYARPASRDHEVDLDVAERLSEAVKLVQRCPQFGHVDVHTTFQPVPRLKARRAEIDQVFVNLVSNAVDAMEGRGRLTLGIDMDGEMIRVRVADTGCGIPRILIGKIFDPFVTTKDPGKGTGLGLSIVYKIVSKYGGRLNVESEERKGSIFTIHFPTCAD